MWALNHWGWGEDLGILHTSGVLCLAYVKVLYCEQKIQHMSDSELNLVSFRYESRFHL
jgi:hypothetical protein